MEGDTQLQDLVLDPQFISKLSPTSLRPLNTYRDTAYLLNTVPSMSSYRTAHRFLSLYLKRRGLYSAKFGYLGGIHLSLMLNRVVKLLAASLPSASAEGKSKLESRQDEVLLFSPATIVRSFFAYYAAFDWLKDIVCDPYLSTESTKHSRSAREPIYIQAIHVPTARLNVASSCTRLSAQTFASEFALAESKLESGDWAWCLRSKDDCASDFLKDFGAFVRITLDFWDTDVLGDDKIREMSGSLESRITGLMVGLGKLDGVKARVWPARFREKKESLNEEGDGTEFRGYYIVGVSAGDDHSVDEKKILTGKVLNTVRMFERTIKELKGFDQGHVWVEVEVVSKNKLQELDLLVDERIWGSASNPASPVPSQSTANTGGDDTAEASTHPQTTTSKKTKSKKLRPAQDIIARIRWDPTLHSDDFLVGYEDRFLGVKEIELGRWKSEQTDLEFIPMHRIVWLRRKGDDNEDGKIVWDREKRLDLICGSGV
jgi:uncharacterized protein (UPF0248 family)